MTNITDAKNTEDDLLSFLFCCLTGAIGPKIVEIVEVVGLVGLFMF